MLRGCTCSVLRLALLLPSRNLGLLTSERTLVVLVVVDLGMVVLDALKQQIARLLEEGVDGKIKRVVIGEEGRLRRVGILLQSS